VCSNDCLEFLSIQGTIFLQVVPAWRVRLAKAWGKGKKKEKDHERSPRDKTSLTTRCDTDTDAAASGGRIVHQLLPAGLGFDLCSPEILCQVVDETTGSWYVLSILPHPKIFNIGTYIVIH